MLISLCLILAIPLFAFVIIGHLNQAKNLKTFVTALDSQDTISQPKFKFMKASTRTGYYKKRKFTLIGSREAILFMDTKLISEHKVSLLIGHPLMMMFIKYKKLDRNLIYYGGKVYYTPWYGLGIKLFFHTLKKNDFRKIFDEIISAATQVENSPHGIRM